MQRAPLCAVTSLHEVSSTRALTLCRGLPMWISTEGIIFVRRASYTRDLLSLHGTRQKGASSLCTCRAFSASCSLSVHGSFSIRPVSRASSTYKGHPLCTGGLLYKGLLSEQGLLFKDISAWGLLYKRPHLCIGASSVSMTSVHETFSTKGILTVQRATLFGASSERASFCAAIFL